MSNYVESRTSGAVDKVSNTLAKAEDSVKDTAEAIVKNPLPVIATAALTAVGVPAPIASAAVTAANGGSAKDIIVSGVSSYVGGKAAETFGAPAEYGTDVGSQQSQMLAAQEAGIPTVTKSTISGAASGATQAAFSGKDPLTGALKGAVTGGGSEYLSELAGQPGSLAADVTRQFSGQALSRALSDRGTTFTPTYTTTPTAPTSVTTTGAGTTPGSSALAQALRTDLGAPIFGGDKDKEGRKSGWNVESLRYMGDVGEA